MSGSETVGSSSTAPKEGKTYGYQGSPESMVGDTVTEQRRKVVEAFDAFMAALEARASDGQGGGSTTPGTPGTPGTDTPTDTPSSGSPGSETPTDTPTETPGSSSPGSSSPGSGGSGSPPGEDAGAPEAREASIHAQREAFRIDRKREVQRRTRRRETAGTPTANAEAARSKHQSDSNQAPLVTASKEFAPAFGSAGRPTESTMEKLSVSTSRRPESAPVAGVPSGLRPIDAYWGSFGTAVERAAVRAKVDHRMLEVVIGSDDRVRVTNNEFYPWRCIASLLITANTGAVYVGTAWLVAPRLLVTAGHCVYMSDEGGWVRQIEVIPGRDGIDRPFGSAIATDFRSVTGWTRDGDSDYDYGAILLPADKRYGDQLGWFGYATRTDDYLRSLNLNLAGYPGDGGKAPHQVEGTQWFHSRTVSDVHARQVTYEIDTYGGQSGAPVWEMTGNGERYGVAIHTWGTTVNNGGTRITGEVFDNIVTWAGQAP